jgi:membrane complex biogenesis BtpA family protein
MVHLAPLPGSSRWDGDWPAILKWALADALALADGGVGGILVENFHDVPFFPHSVPPTTVAAMAVLVTAIRQQHPRLAVGVNILRNDAEAALAVAQAGQAQFIRVNLHAGAAVADQGLLLGQAHRTMRLRRELGLDVGLLADLRVKHAAPLIDRPLGEEALELRDRALADGIVLSGPATGEPPRREDLQTVRRVLPACPLLAGSGLTPGNVGEFADLADGFIVGTALKEVSAPGWGSVGAAKVAAFVEAVNVACANRKDTK